MDAQTTVFLLFILMLSVFLGIELISRVPSARCCRSLAATRP